MGQPNPAPVLRLGYIGCANRPITRKLGLAHVHTNDQGVAWIDDTNVNVIEGAQIHAALTDYYDHQAGMDREIERQLQESDALAAAARESPLRARLRAAGRLP